MNNNKKHPLIDLLPELLQNRPALIELARQSFLSHFYIHSDSYLEYPMAEFHNNLFAIGQDAGMHRAVVVGFRNSAKSTILNTGLALWGIMGTNQYKFIVIVSQTQQQARRHLRNIRDSLEQNQLLKEHFGPFQYQEGRETWNASTLDIPKYGARIIAVSMEESVRGLRSGPHRPDLIICDDIEDLESSRTRERRDKTFNWITGEIFPLGGPNTKVIILANFVHEDAAGMRLLRQIQEGHMPGQWAWIPLIDEEGRVTWPGKYPTPEAIARVRQDAGSESAYQRDYLLKFFPGDEQILKPEDIHYYDALPPFHINAFGERTNGRKGPKRHGVDLAVGEKETADKLAVVSGDVYKVDRVAHLYLDPHPVNTHMTFPDFLEFVKTLRGGKFYVEDVQFQKACVQVMKHQRFNAVGMNPGGRDKIARFQAAAVYIKNGLVRFPRKGCEDLIQQLLYFGQERYDDLMDALVYLILGLVEDGGFGGGARTTVLDAPRPPRPPADMVMPGEDFVNFFNQFNNPEGSW